MGQCATINNRCSKCGFVASNAKHQNLIQAMKQHQCHRPKPILKENNSSKSSLGKLNEARKKQKIDTRSFIKMKVPIDNSNTKFKWIDQPLLSGLEEITKVPKQAIKKGSFQQKLAWFRGNLDNLKKQSSRDYQLIKVDRQNIIKSSLQSLEGVNLMKELRIQFNGDQAQDAGGGLLRQWMHLCVKQIMSDSLGIFKQANTDETAYQFYWSNSVSDEDSFEALYLLGLIIGKALLQKISINCCLDRTIIRQICSQPIHLSDVYSYDKAFYRSWDSIFKMPNVDDLGLDGTVYHRFSQSQVQQIQIFPNGKKTVITNDNKEMYISELINLYCTKSVQSYIDQLTNAIYSFIPAQLLQIFQPHQFEMILNGPSFIDIKDWKNNTVYDNYESDNQVIQWFWKIVEGYGQQGYTNLLHYCTGSARVPILGFSHLQTNHGHVKKFTIRKIQYDQKNPYPKSYTCFNRLDLPKYSSQQQLRQKLAFIMREQFTYFGLC